MEVTKIPKKIVTVIEPKRSMAVDKEKYRQKRVAAYCRVSTDSEEQLVSYANQKKVYTEMIGNRKDWCFAGMFADEGKSGTRADMLKPHGKDIIVLDRSFEGIRSYLENHVIEGIVFWKDGEPQCKIKRKDFNLPWG